jgi:hypothetical protein
VRTIKPGFYKNEQLAECSVWARYIFPGLWMLADRAGRLEDRPKRIKAELLPFDRMVVEPLLRQLEQARLIYRYKTAAGKFIQIIKFVEHQYPHYTEKPSAIMPPELPEFGFLEGGTTPGIDTPLSPVDNPLLFLSIGKPLKEKKGATAPKEKTNDSGSLELPDWLPAKDWQAFVDHRKKLRRPMTAEAQRRAIARLDAFRQRGIDPAYVLDETIANGWQGLYEPKNGIDKPIDFEKLVRELQERDEEMERIRNATP